MFFVLLALAEPGVEVLYPNPGFPIYESMINFCGATPVPLPLREEFDFRFDVDEFRSLITDRTRLIILNSPQNPTGGYLQRKELAAIAEVCVERDIMVLADEVYEHILYEGEFASLTTFAGMSTRERTIILHGFSKSYAMTGWRLGFGVMPLALAEQIKRLEINSNSCTSASNQYAGLAALQGSQQCVLDMVAEFRRRRDVIVAGLNAIPGITCRKLGRVLCFFQHHRHRHDGRVRRLFHARGGVACLSGRSFGVHGEGTCVRPTLTRWRTSNSAGADRRAGAPLACVISSELEMRRRRQSR